VRLRNQRLIMLERNDREQLRVQEFRYDAASSFLHACKAIERRQPNPPIVLQQKNLPRTTLPAAPHPQIAGRSVRPKKKSSPA
jgi:hypothetical protein